MVAAIRIGGRLACLIALLAGLPALADNPPRLSRGINITGWFRFPPNRDPAVLAGYLSDQALADLRSAGFDFARLAIDPDLVAAPAAMAVLIRSIARIERTGLSVIVSPHPVTWHLETEPDRLRQFWRRLAPLLRRLDPARTLPEVANEPVFADDPPAWAHLQHRILADVHAALPQATVVLTGADWGSIRGLLALTPEHDAHVLYSFHFYDPPELTALAAYRSGLDTTALARLPFPAPEPAACNTTVDATPDAPTRDMIRYYCALAWDEAALRKRIGEATAWAQAHHVQLLAGEFGASSALNAPARLAWFHVAQVAFDKAQIPWALWGYDDVMGHDIARPPSSRPVLNPDVLRALGMTTGK
ncbi:MAG: glycoside hydrolase family 5 protein [Rhodopila sp.]